MARAEKILKKPVWLKYTDEEVKGIILKILEKEPGITAEKIGLILRDNYGIPTSRIYRFKISEVLKEAKKYESPDLKNLQKKISKIEKHLADNKKDEVSKRALIIAKARLKKVESYLKRG